MQKEIREFRQVEKFRQTEKITLIWCVGGVNYHFYICPFLQVIATSINFHKGLGLRLAHNVDQALCER